MPNDPRRNPLHALHTIRRAEPAQPPPTPEPPDDAAGDADEGPDAPSEMDLLYAVVQGVCANPATALMTEAAVAKRVDSMMLALLSVLSAQGATDEPMMSDAVMATASRISDEEAKFASVILDTLKAHPHHSIQCDLCAAREWLESFTV